MQGMLATLPVAGNISAEQAITSSTREAIAASIGVDYVNQSDALAFKVSGFSMVVGLLILPWHYESLVTAPGGWLLSRYSHYCRDGQGDGG